MTNSENPKFISPEDARQQLSGLLQQALMLELSTIPAYATACYSIQEQGQYDRSSPQIVNAEPIEVIRQVMVEEMLHMILVANVINAIGEKPCLNDPGQLPSYPHKLFKHSDFKLHLRSFTPKQIKAFRELERAPKSENLKRAATGDFRTIAGFYFYTGQILEMACDIYHPDAIFVGDIKRQISGADYYGAGGEVIVVDSLETAKNAIEEIVKEGEGANLGEHAGDGDRIPAPQGEERWDIAHFFKFDGILHSRYYQATDTLDDPPSGDNMIVNWNAVWPMKDDPKGADYDSLPEIKALSDRFNTTYSELLNGLNDSFNGKKERLADLVPIMYRLKEDAQRLLRVPLPGNNSGMTAGPTWEYKVSS